MATLNAQKLKKIPSNGQHGDACIFTSAIVLAAASVADVVYFAELPPYCEVIDVELVNDALGASTTFNCGYAYVDSTVGSAAPTAYQAAASKTSAGKTRGTFHPILHEHATYVTATLAGAAATGTVTAIIHYRYIGSM